MSENVQPHEQSQSHEQQQLIESMRRFEAGTTELTQIIPELQTRPEIFDAGIDLINEFGIKPSLFENEGRTIVFTSIASRWAETSNKTDPNSLKEKVFVADTIALLANNHSYKLAEAKKIIDIENKELDDKATRRIYDKYTDDRLSAALTEQITNGGMLDAVKGRLSITAENEDPIVLRVLTVGSTMQTMGLDVGQINYDYSTPNARAETEAAQQEQADVKHWKAGLKQRSIDMAKELGHDQAFADAWVTTIEGVKNLCVSSALAEKLLDPSLTKNTSHYGEKDLRNDLATLEHEYTHTQGGVNLDSGIIFGINIEELRAENFAENNLGYQDIKGFFRDYRLITGQDVAKELNQLPKGGSITEVYSLIANKVGINNMLNVLLASPNNYIEGQSNSFITEAYNHIGGFDGVLEAILAQEIANGNGTEIETRINNAAQQMLTVIDRPDSVFDIDSLSNYRKRFGLNVVTDMVAARAKSQKAA